MRFLSFLILVVLLGAVGLFAWQNQGAVAVRFWNQEMDQPLALLIGGAYVLGMLSGWSVLGIFRRSFNRMTAAAPRENRTY
jgi:uncharacterized integral membrane protein